MLCETCGMARRGTLLPLLVVVLVVLGEAAGAESWKIATYNINWGDPDLAAVAAAIRRADADVVCLQETTQRSEPYLRRVFGKTYPEIRFHGHKGEYAAERFGIMARVPVSNVRFLLPKHGLFGAYACELQLGGRRVQLIIVHIEPILIDEGAGLMDALAAMNAMEETHLKEIRHIWESRRKDVALVVAGDFNSPAQCKAPTFLREKGLADSFADVHARPDTAPTWHWPTRWGELSLRIDYIFRSKELRTLRSEVIKSDGSDHYLLMSELQWQADPAKPDEAEQKQAR